MSQTQARERYTQGVNFRIANHLSQALEAQKQAIALDSNLFEAFYEAGLLNRISGNYTHSVELSKEATRINPEFWPAYLDQGICYRLMGDHEQAYQAFSKTLQFQPNLTDGKYFLALSLLALRKTTEAEKYFNEVIRAKPESAEAHFMLALCLRYQGKFREAEPCLKTAVRLQPDFGAAKELIGQAGQLEATQKLTHEFVKKFGLKIQRGPFRGMNCSFDPTCHDNSFFGLLPKLSGTFEEELHLVVQLILKKNYQSIINIGCADGFYAVGLARLLPQTQVYAYDIEAEEQKKCKELAALNQVQAQVTVGGRCDFSELSRRIQDQTLIVCDIEGGEKELLDPTKAPELLRADLLVELHDLFDPTITPTLLKRFCKTHSITLINSMEKFSEAYQEFFPNLPKELHQVMDERKEEMQWAFMTPR